MKPITRQLIVAVFVLTLVTVASLGIRHVRFSAHRAKSVESPVIAETESDPGPAQSPAVDPEPEPQSTEASGPVEQAPMEDYPQPKSLKSDYAKAKGSKGSLEEISLGENENLYITAKGETWYVAEGPDGKTTKMRVEIDEATGEMTVVELARKSAGLQPIPMGGSDNVYITEEGQTWYVTENSKSRVEIDDSTGEIAVLEQHVDGDDDK
jgi:hypothetical protein